MISRDSFGALSSLEIEGEQYRYYSLPALERKGLGEVSRLPFSLRILLENLLRHEDGESVTARDIEALVKWDPQAEPSQEIAFSPARVVLQDFTGVPSVVDLAAMREAMSELGGDSQKINPPGPVRTGHRPFRAGRLVCHCHGSTDQCPEGVRTQS